MSEIIGIGQDMVDIRRIAAVLERSPRFAARIASPAELKALPTAPRRRSAAIAKIFAAKEACFKAMGTGLRAGMSWHDVVLSRSALGAPVLKISDQLAAIIGKHHCNDLCNDSTGARCCGEQAEAHIGGIAARDTINRDCCPPSRFRLRCLITLSDEPPYALAAAVLVSNGCG